MDKSGALEIHGHIRGGDGSCGVGCDDSGCRQMIDRELDK